jgi:hypothetical protein
MVKYKTLYKKEYFEEYARLCLNDLFNLNLIHRKERYGKNGDRPDLISKDEKIGVEVTQGITEKDGRHYKLFQQEYPQNESRNKAIREEAQRLGVDKDLKFIDKHATLSNECDIEHSLKGILLAVNKKLNDLNKKGYNLYKSNQLFIFAGGMFPAKPNEVVVEILKEQETFKVKYDIIYLLNNDILYLIKNDNFNDYDVPLEKRGLFKENAQEFVKLKQN